MFNKTPSKCPRCNNNVSKGYEFCPYCGSQLKPLNQSNKPREDDWGMLGEDDLMQPSEPQANPFASGFLSGGILNKMLGNAMKMLEKEMQKEMKNRNNLNPEEMSIQPKTNLQIYINGKKVNIGTGKPTISKEKQSGKIIQSKPAKTIKEPKLPAKELKNFSKLPKEEPETTIRRLSDRIIYEISMPGVKSKKGISITKLENSIEIRALAKDRAYHKIIKVSLPVINYSLDNQTLILELAAK